MFGMSTRQVLIQKCENLIKAGNTVPCFCLAANLYNCSLNVVV